MTDDPVDGYLVRFGGVLGNQTFAATWTYQAGSWRNITAGAQPSPRLLPAMGFDFADGYVVLFGGANIVGGNLTTYADTWAFHGGKWTQIVTGSGPSSRFGASFAYDPAEGGLVLFGGASATGSGEFNDTWLYKAGNWSRLDPTGRAPSPRLGFSMAWDTADSELVGFGGATVCTVSCSAEFVGRNDTWTFANGSWSNLSRATNPPVAVAETSQLVNVSAANQLVLFENLNASLPNNCETWAFSGGNWTELHPGLQACGVDSPEAAWDSEDGTAVFYGASAAPEVWEPTWAYVGGNWSLADNYSYPGAIYGGSLAYDAASGDAYLTGGQSGPTTFNQLTYRFDGSEWHVLSLSPTPPPRDSGAFAYDPSLGGMVLFGGENGTAVENDTWLLKSGTWTRIGGGGPGPASRGFAGMTFDPSLGEMLLFGGSVFAGGTFSDTWVLNGTGWAQLHPTTSPSARTSFGLSYDPLRKADVAFGGESYSAGRYTYFNDTWEFTGGTWSKVATPVAPSARDGVGFVYDPAAGGDVLYGGFATASDIGDAWVLTSTGWALLAAGGTPSARAFTCVYFDTAQDTLWLYGGLISSSRSFYVYGYEYVLDTLSVAGSSNVTTGPVPLSVQFGSTYTGGASPVVPHWTFGDGQSSNLSNATHVYDRGGNYTAEVTETDALGLVADWTVVIYANGSGIAPLNVTGTATPTSGRAPLLVNFTASARGGVAPYTLVWAFGDSSSATGAAVNHTYDTVNVFVAIVTATDAIGSTASTSFSINVSQGIPPPPPPPSKLPPGANFTVTLTVTPSSGTAPLTVAAAANATGGYGTVQYTWDFGDGSTGSGPSAQHTFAAAGTYLVSVTAKDPIGDTAENQTNVTVAAATPHGASSGGTVPIADLLAIVAVAALALVIASAYFARRRGGGGARPPRDRESPADPDAPTDALLPPE